MAAKRDLRKQAAATKPQTAADLLIDSSSTTEEPETLPRRMISLLINEDTYRDLKDLAKFRSVRGEVNRRGQAMSAASLLNIAAQEYVDRNRQELEQWRTFRSRLLDEFDNNDK